MINDVKGNPIYISPSMINTGGKCQMQLKWFYLERLKFAPGFAREVGEAFHKTTLVKDQKGFNETREWTPLVELKQLATDHLKSVTPEIDPADDWITEFEGRRQAYTKAQSLTHMMLDEYDTDRERLSGRVIEWEFGYDEPIPFAGQYVRGRIDIDVSDTHARDLKTRRLAGHAKRRKEEDVHNDGQFSVLAAVKARITGSDYQRFDASCMYAIDQVKTKKAELEAIPTVRVKQQHELIEDRAYRLYRAMEQDTLVPVDKATSNGWVCSARFCGAWDSICPYGRRSQVQV